MQEKSYLNAMRNLLIESAQKKRIGREMADPEFGCALSHLFVYKKIIDEKIDYTIVLEDDAILGQDFAKMIKPQSWKSQK